jgi:aldehyde:ferredoxin oxidoreductase
MPNGYGGKIIKIDLSREKVIVEDTPMKILKKYIGGKGFAAKYLYDNLDNIDPLSPENILIIAVGPASGTKIPIAAKIGFFFKSPVTMIFGESYMGGNIMAEMKWAGVDAIIIRGRASKPVYIYIHDGDAEIRDASEVWGLSTHESEDRIKEDIGDNSASVAVIGPAGENLVRYANVSHNHGPKVRESKAGRTGAGAVMGSKKLKAIAVKAGERKVDVYDSDVVSTLVKEVLTMVSKDPIGTGAKNYRTYGTPITLAYGQELGFFPSKYYTIGGTTIYDKLDPEILKEKYYDHIVACFNCIMSCGKYTCVREGKYKGVETKGPEYETIFAFGGLNMIDDYSALAKINEVCDLYGLDTIDTGNIISLAIFAKKKGRLKLDYDISYNDPDGILEIIEKIVYREGIGNSMAEGILPFSREHGIEDLAMHVKGLSPPGYDPRVLKAMALEFSISTRGADHLRMTGYAYEISGILKRYDNLEDKVSFLVDVEDRFIISDSLILCRFSRFIYTWDKLERMIYGLTGFRYSQHELREIARDIRTLIRKFNIRQGLNPNMDILSDRYFEEPVKLAKNGEKRISRQEVEEMVKMYYKTRGWREDGYPE